MVNSVCSFCVVCESSLPLLNASFRRRRSEEEEEEERFSVSGIRSVLAVGTDNLANLHPLLF